MKRRVVQVAKIRIKDAEVGDVVHRDPKERKGWFKVAMREVLFNGDLQLSDVSTHITLSGGHYDMIGVQFVQEVEVPDQNPHAVQNQQPPQDAAQATAPQGVAEQPASPGQPAATAQPVPEGLSDEGQGHQAPAVNPLQTPVAQSPAH